jgi:putative phosphoesterase
MLIGVISDTHGLLRPEAVEALRSSDLIVHAGDIGNPSILDELAKLAPVRAIRGNIDTEAWSRKLPETDVVEIGDVSIYVLHNVHDLDLNPRAAGFAAVISGHSHKPSSEVRDGVLYLNPGSAGPRRFSLPISVGRLRLRGGKIVPEVVELQITQSPRR